MCNRKELLVCLAVVCIGVSAALACGPDFPWQLLDDRAATLTATPVNSFAFEATRLVALSSDRLQLAEYQDQLPEAEGLSAAQIETVRRMRTASTGEEAFTYGAEAPLAVRFYTAGAVAFRKEDEERAIPRFQSVLNLPKEEQRLRATWAAYMLGSCYARLGDTEKAAKAFQHTRELVLAGTPDPLGLALASYGEEAKLHFEQARSIVSTSESSQEQTIAYAREMTAAVALYAKQAAHNSTSGIQSLRIVAEQLVHNTPERLTAILADPTIHRLLVVYVLARGGGDFPRQVYTENGAYTPPNPFLDALVEALEQRGFENHTGLDRLAALAYQSGRYDLAERLTANTAGALTSWIKAKLALQKGDLAAAATLYAEAVKAFPPADQITSLEREKVRLLTGERGVLMLARGEYVEALAQLYPVASTYWGDVAYLAERVLTIEELQRFIDTNVLSPKTSSAEQSTEDNTILAEDVYFWVWSLPADPAARLRSLLARRLVRAGRYQEALTYFPALDPTNPNDPDIRTQVAAYAQALRDAEQDWWPIERAQEWYNAAILVRKFGRAMMGTETAPDFSANGGYYDFGIGHTPSAGPFVTEGELQRFSASAPNPNTRCHYCSLPIESLTRAVDLLPPRSQAFAAVLCQATGWTMNEEPQRAREFYRRYVQQGPYVPWAARFGRNCPEPNFEAAAYMAKMQPFHDARQFARRSRWLIGGGLVAVIGAIIAWRARQLNKGQG